MPFVACSNLDGYRVSCVKFIKYYMCFYNNTMDFHKMRQNSAVGLGLFAHNVFLGCSAKVALGSDPVFQGALAVMRSAARMLRISIACKLSVADRLGALPRAKALPHCER